MAALRARRKRTIIDRSRRFRTEAVLLWVLCLNYCAVLDANDAVCAACDAFIVGDDNNSFVVLFVHLVQERDNLLACFLVEVARWLVTKHYLRVVGKGSCYRTSLLLTARKLRRQVTFSVRKSEYIAKLVDVSSIGTLARQQHGDDDVFGDRQLGDKAEFLEHKADVLTPYFCELFVLGRGDFGIADVYISRGGFIKAAEHIQKR